MDGVHILKTLKNLGINVNVLILVVMDGVHILNSKAKREKILS